MQPPKHSAPLRLGTPGPGQRNDLMLDFGVPVALGSCVAAFTVNLWVSEAYTLVAAVTAALLALSVLWHRLGAVRVELVGDAFVVRNVLWSYRIPVDSISAVVVRRSWVGGVYAYCFGLKTHHGLHRFRSAALHAVTGEGRQRRELEELEPAAP